VVIRDGLVQLGRGQHRVLVAPWTVARVTGASTLGRITPAP
jgi:hypothetical protein